MVLIALLPKPDGGFRPIDLLPIPPRIGMRARRKAARRWEELNSREWLCTGKGKGVNVAAWKQAFFAELAATMKHSVEYIQTLLDLVKAFDKVPPWLLIREAIALGYPLRILRLSIATYQLKRVIRIGSVVSKVVTAVTGIAAGSGFATTEMRLVLIRVIDRALTLFSIGPSLCSRPLRQTSSLIIWLLRYVLRRSMPLARWVASSSMSRTSSRPLGRVALLRNATSRRAASGLEKP